VRTSVSASRPGPDRRCRPRLRTSRAVPDPSLATRMLDGRGSPCTTAFAEPARRGQARRQAVAASGGVSDRSTSPPRSTGEQHACGRRAGALRPSCSDRVEAAQRRGRGGPVARLWRRTVEPGLNDHPVDVRAAIGCRDDRRKPGGPHRPGSRADRSPSQGWRAGAETGGRPAAPWPRRSSSTVLRLPPSSGSITSR